MEKSGKKIIKKKTKFNPEDYGWVKTFENVGLSSWEKGPFNMTFNKGYNTWIIFLMGSVNIPVFIGKINSDEDYILLSNILCFDSTTVNSVIK